MAARCRFRLRGRWILVFNRSLSLRWCHVRPEGPLFDSHDRKVVEQNAKNFVRPEGPTVGRCQYEKALANIVNALTPTLARLLTRLPCPTCLEIRCVIPRSSCPICGLFRPNFLADLSLSCRQSSKTTANPSRHVHCTPRCQRKQTPLTKALALSFSASPRMQSTEV